MKISKLLPFVMTLLASIVASLSVAHAQSFDRFLDGFDRQCKTNAQFEDFSRSLGQRVFQGGQTQLPQELRSAFGAARIVRKSDHMDVFVPLTGATWRGVPLAGIQFFMGIENGISVNAVVFAAPASEVRRVFGPTVTASARAMQADPNNESGSTISLGTTAGKPSIVCDLST
jgi:hypothetical protein